MRAPALAFASLLASVTATSAETIATCGESNGYGFYPRAGLAVSDPEAGKWVDDGVSGGKISLVSLPDGKFDLMFADVTGGIYSTTAEGGRTFVAFRDATTISVLAIHRMGAVETYTFIETADGPQVLWTSNKSLTPIPKVAAYQAACSYLDLGHP